MRDREDIETDILAGLKHLNPVDPKRLEKLAYYEILLDIRELLLKLD